MGKKKKTSSESPHLPSPSLPLEIMQIYIVPQTSICHPSMDLPYNSYVCPMMTFPFFIPSVFINLDASVSSFSVSSAFFITVKEKSYYGREPLLLKFAVCFWWGLMVYISLDSWRSSIIEIGTQSRSDWMVSGDRTRSHNLLCGWQACYGTHRSLISIYRWYLTSRHWVWNTD